MIKVEAFQTIAGSSLGGDTYSIALDLVTWLHDFPNDMSKEDFQKVFDWEHELANDEVPDDEVDDLLEEIKELAENVIDMPASCSLEFVDNELRVQPYIDDDLPRIEAGNSTFYDVNDHGNVTCYNWDGESYKPVWSMV